VAFLCIFYYLKNREYFKLVSKLPGPHGLDLIRVAFELLKLKPNNIIPYLVKMHKKFGHVIRIMIGPHCVVFLTEPKDVEKVLLSQKCLRKSVVYKCLDDWLATGLLTSSGAKWHSRRKIITPAFHFKILDQFVATFEKHSAKFVENLRDSKMGGAFDIAEPLTMSTFYIIFGKCRD
jgi:cytochrome P450 family 4